MSARGLSICHLFPEALNLYGDGGNIITLVKRLQWRGIEAKVQEVSLTERPRFSDFDLVFIGGGSDREQRIVCERLLAQKTELRAFTEDGGALLAVCGGYQLLGHSYAMGDETLEGLGLVDLTTTRGTPRLIGNIAVESEICAHPIVGYENHGGRTHLGPGVRPLGKVAFGHGNDGKSGEEGAISGTILGTYIHGPLLPKNPGVADWVLARALEHRGDSAELEPLDDAEELAANAVMAERLMSGQEKE